MATDSTLTSIELHYLRSAARDWYDLAVWDWDENERADFVEYVVAQDCMDQHLPTVYRVFQGITSSHA